MGPKKSQKSKVKNWVWGMGVLLVMYKNVFLFGTAILHK